MSDPETIDETLTKERCRTCGHRWMEHRFARSSLPFDVPVPDGCECCAFVAGELADETDDE